MARALESFDSGLATSSAFTHAASAFAVPFPDASALMTTELARHLEGEVRLGELRGAARHARLALASRGVPNRGRKSAGATNAPSPVGPLPAGTVAVTVFVAVSITETLPP